MDSQNQKWSVVLSVLICSGVFCARSTQAAILATVNETSIDSKDLQSEYSQLNEQQRERINKDQSTKRELVEGAVNAELVVQAAKKSGVEQEEEFRRAVERFKKQYLATRYMQKSIESKLTKSAIKEYFEKNRGNYDSSQVHAMHILSRTEDEARKVLELARSAKSDQEFSIIAKKNSVDPTVQDNGGDLGFFTRDRMVPEFAAAAFSMKKGEVRGPIRSTFGYHVIRIVEIKMGTVPNFEEVEARVKDDLRAQLAKDLLQQLRSKASVKLNEDEVKSLKI